MTKVDQKASPTAPSADKSSDDVLTGRTLPTRMETDPAPVAPAGLTKSEIVKRLDAHDLPPVGEFINDMQLAAALPDLAGPLFDRHALPDDAELNDALRALMRPKTPRAHTPPTGE